MRHYPLFLDLTGQTVLVAGAGEVGLRKAGTILKAGPRRVDLVDPHLDAAAVRAKLPSPRLTLLRRAFEPSDIHDKCLVFAATGSRAVNALISGLCRENRILCNVADAPEEGGFIVPSIIDAEGLTLAISTGGQSPAFAKSLRRELEAWVQKRYIPFLALLGRLRPLLLGLGLPTEENSALFRELVASSLPDLLQNREFDAASALLTELLPEALHPRMGELFHGL